MTCRSRQSPTHVGRGALGPFATPNPYHNYFKFLPAVASFITYGLPSIQQAVRTNASQTRLVSKNRASPAYSMLSTIFPKLALSSM
jgi:hypothetical protein